MENNKQNQINIHLDKLKEYNPKAFEDFGGKDEILKYI